MTEKEIKKLTPEDLKKMKGMEGTVEDIVAAEIMNMLRFGPTTVKPSFLKERGVTLPEYIEVPSKRVAQN